MMRHLLCRLLGHDVRSPFPGDRALCLRCNKRWRYDGAERASSLT